MKLRVFGAYGQVDFLLRPLVGDRAFAIGKADLSNMMLLYLDEIRCGLAR